MEVDDTCAGHQGISDCQRPGLTSRLCRRETIMSARWRAMASVAAGERAPRMRRGCDLPPCSTEHGRAKGVRLNSRCRNLALANQRAAPYRPGGRPRPHHLRRGHRPASDTEIRSPYRHGFDLSQLAAALADPAGFRAMQPGQAQPPEPAASSATVHRDDRDRVGRVNANRYDSGRSLVASTERC